MKPLISILTLSVILFACNGKPANYPNATVKDVLTKINWNGNFEEVRDSLENIFKLEFGTTKFNQSGGARAFEFTGGKFLGENTSSWVAGFLHDKLNAIIINYAENVDTGKLYDEICGKLESSLGPNKMELEKSKFWIVPGNERENNISVICNITPDNKNVMVVIKRNNK